MKIINETNLFLPLYMEEIWYAMSAAPFYTDTIQIVNTKDYISIQLAGEDNLGGEIYHIKKSDYQKVIGILLKDSFIAHWSSKQYDNARGYGYLYQDNVMTCTDDKGDCNYTHMSSSKFGAGYILYLISKGIPYTISDGHIHLWFNDHRENSNGEWI